MYYTYTIHTLIGSLITIIIREHIIKEELNSFHDVLYV